MDEENKLDNSPHKKSVAYGSSGRRAVFAGLIIALGLLVYMTLKGVHHAPAKHAQSSWSLTTASDSESDTQDIPLGFLVGGQVTQMFFAEKAEVKRGDVLATLDKTPFEEALTAARAQLQLAQADYGKASRIPTSNFNAIEAARANVETAQHNYDSAHDELEKRRSIMVAGQLDNVYTDDVQNEQDAAHELEKARRALAQEEDAAGNSTDRSQLQASIQAAQANLAIAETNLSNAQLVAPAAGVVSERKAEVGATVLPGAPVYVLTVSGKAAP